MNNIFKIASLFMLSNSAMAEFIVHLPLEANLAGRLPDGSISFIQQPNTPTDPTTTPEPASSDCHYNLTDMSQLAAYVDGYLTGSDSYTKEIIYQGREVINGTKGALQFTQEGLSYSEVCFDQSGPIFKVDSAQDTNWEVDDCRFNRESDKGAMYYWAEISGLHEYLSERAFTNAELGSLGSISYQSSGLLFPQGFISTNYGYIFPEDNNMIGRGSVYFSRGNAAYNNIIEGRTYSYFAVCKHTTN